MYLLADFVEDTRLWKLLGQPVAVTQEAVTTLKKFTALKFATIFAAIVQTVAALATYLWFLGLRLP
jgi:hypothetical protein